MQQVISLEEIAIYHVLNRRWSNHRLEYIAEVIAFDKVRCFDMELQLDHLEYIAAVDYYAVPHPGYNVESALDTDYMDHLEKEADTWTHEWFRFVVMVGDDVFAAVR